MKFIQHSEMRFLLYAFIFCLGIALFSLLFRHVGLVSLLITATTALILKVIIFSKTVAHFTKPQNACSKL